MENELLDNKGHMKGRQHTINAQYTTSIDSPKKKLKGEICLKAKGVCPN
jgi:hypothetical protein